MPQLYIGNLEIGKIPRIVSVVSEPEVSKIALESKEAGADLLEVRVDCYEYKNPKSIENILRKAKLPELPVIATIRKSDQVGRYAGTEAERYELFKSVIDTGYVDIIDIELTAEEIREDVIKYAKNKNKNVIVSYHRGFTPPDLNEIVEKAHSTGGDIVKIATLARSEADVRALLGIVLKYQDKFPIAAISMGQIGRVSRFVFPLFGSCLTYGYVRKPVTSDQFHVSALRNFFDDYDPKLVEEFISNNIDHVGEEVYVA